jgi:hypothetical protein
MAETNHGDPLQPYCAACGVQRADRDICSHLLGARYKCANGEIVQGHVAAVVPPAMQAWVRFAACLARYQVMRWLPRNLVFRGKTGLCILATVAALLLALVGPLSHGLSWVFMMLAAFVIWDVLVYSVSVAFVTQGPRFPLRTVILTLAALLQLGLGFGVVYRTLAPPLAAHAQWTVGAADRSLSAVEALYLSFVTMATVGFGDINPADRAWGAQAAVVAQICVGFVYFACVLATVVSWVGAPPRLRTLNELLEQQGAAQQEHEPVEVRAGINRGLR